MRGGGRPRRTEGRRCSPRYFGWPVLQDGPSSKPGGAVSFVAADRENRDSHALREERVLLGEIDDVETDCGVLLCVADGEAKPLLGGSLGIAVRSHEEVVGGERLAS